MKKNQLSKQPADMVKPSPNTLQQLSDNLRKGSRSGANVKIKLRTLEKISDEISKPVIIGETEKIISIN